MIQTTFTGQLAKIATPQPDASARIEATLALVQQTAEDQGVSAEALLKSLTEKDALNVVVEKFWLEAKESMLLADDGKKPPPVTDISVDPSKTPVLDKCGTWDNRSNCPSKPDNQSTPTVPKEGVTFDACGTWGEKCDSEKKPVPSPGEQQR